MYVDSILFGCHNLLNALTILELSVGTTSQRIEANSIIDRLWLTMAFFEN